MKKIIMKIVSLICSLIKIERNTILIIESSFPSGSNTKPLEKKLKQTFKTDVMNIKDIHFEKKSWPEYLKYIKILIHISKYHIIITTHGFKKPNPNQLLIDLWHGIPLKAMMFMEQLEGSYDQGDFNSDYLITSSKLESTLLSASTHIPFSKHKILGSPRNDYLFQRKTSNDFTKKFEQYNKILLYVPTYRQGYLNRVEGKRLDFSHTPKFINYLTEHSYLLIIKLHPLEEHDYSNQSDNPVYHLTNTELINHNLDLYQILPYIDLLITDYSSIYFDYLLLDRPMIFINQDLNQYREKRGLLLEPYDDWTPGIKAKTPGELIQSIEDSFQKDDYKQKREELKRIFHLHQDGQSTLRIINLINQLVKE